MNLKYLEISSDILEIIDNANEMTQSDLQSAIEAQVSMIYEKGYNQAILDKIPY